MISNGPAALVPARRSRSPTGEPRVHGALNFLVDPALAADVCPAIWRNEHNPSVVVAHAADGCEAQLGAALATRTVTVEAQTEAGRHLVLTGRRARHRLLVVRVPSAPPEGYWVPADGCLPIRLAALMAYHDPDGPGAAAARAALAPSHYQRHRLGLLLALLDRRDPGSGDLPTLRQLARDPIFPGLKTERAIDWKSSTHRRQAQRLVAEARRMSMFGYRDLLKSGCRAPLTTR